MSPGGGSGSSPPAAEAWREYIRGLEQDRLRAVADMKSREAQALQEVGDATDDLELQVAARAKRAAADEFYETLGIMDKRRGA